MSTKNKINAWLRQQGYSVETVKNYRHHLIELHKWLLHKGIALPKMSGDEFLRYLDGREWSDSMRRQALCAVRAFVKGTLGKEHPVFEVKVRRPEKRPQRTMRVEDVRLVLSVIDLDRPNGVRDYAMICLLVDTGLRASEVCNLRLSELDLDRCQLNTRVKGGGYRDAAFTTYTKNCLEDWLVLRGAYAGEHDRVFCGCFGHAPGAPMTRGGLRAIFRKLAKRAGVSSFSPHSFRRGMATIMLADNRASDRVVQLAGGWKDRNMVSHYSQALDVEVTRPYLAMRAVRPEDDTPSGDEKADWLHDGGIE